MGNYGSPEDAKVRAIVADLKTRKELENKFAKKKGFTFAHRHGEITFFWRPGEEQGQTYPCSIRDMIYHVT